MAIKKQTKTQLKKKADTLFSQYIRQKYADWKGDVSCYTCGKVAPWKEMQCGHFIKRSNLSVRWDEENCRVQCAGCNVFKNGNYHEYTFRLLREIGEKGLKELEEKGRKMKQWRDADLVELIAVLKEKLDNA